MKTLEALDQELIWHPFTQMKEWQRETPLVIERAQGNYLIDTRGRRYLDGVSSLWCNVHGHRVREIDKAVKDQLGRVAHTTFLGLTHKPAIELSKELLSIAPKGLSRVFYSDSGSAAVEVALKMAYQYWQLAGERSKTKFLSLKNAYHGDTLGSVSVGGIDLFHSIFHPLLFKGYQAPAPYRYRDSFQGSDSQYARYCAGRVEDILKKHSREICALIVEPLMQGAAGMLSQPRGYLGMLKRLTQKYRVLLIADEVATGFGRTGKMFACEHAKISPDILCVAKGLTGGYLPLSATLTTEAVYEKFLGEYSQWKAFFHGHTYSANPLACAAALANLKKFKQEKTIEKLGPKVFALKKELWKLRRLSSVGEIRQVAFMVGIELVRDKKTRKSHAPEERVGHRVAMAARKHGVILRPLGNVIVLMPPLSITEHEIQVLCRAVAQSIREVTP